MDAAAELSPILIVDDDKSLVAGLVELFDSKGVRADRAHTAREALQRLHERPVDPLRERGYYRAVLLDIMMETDTAGLDILPAVRRYDPNLPVVYLSAVANEDRAVDAIKQGAVLMLNKPVDFQVLYYAFLSAVKYAEEQRRFRDQKLADANKQILINRLFNHSVKNLSYAGQAFLAVAPPEVGKARQCFDRIQDQAQRLMAMTTEPAAGDSTPDLAAVLAQVRTDLADTPQVEPAALDRVRLDAAADTPPVRIKPDTLAAVLGELVFNAIVHNPGRPVAVAVAARPLPNGLVEVRVGDDGAGVPADRRAGLFHVRPDRAEHGFGLPYCYQVARVHGGDLRYDEADRPGGAFVLTLPAFAEGRDA